MRDATVLDGLKTHEPDGEHRGTVQTYGDLKSWAESFTQGESDSDSGVKVNRKTAFYAPAVWQAASMITGDLAKLPCDLYRRTEDDGREIERNKTHKLVRRRPNREEHAFGMWRYAYGCALCLGGAFIYIKRNGRGEPIELTPLDPDRCVLERIAGELWVKYSTTMDNRPYQKAIRYDDVLHIKGLCLEASTLGARLVWYARSTIGLSLARQRYASKFFKNGAKQSGFLHFGPGTNQENRENVMKAVDKFNADETKWNAVAPLRDGHKFIPTSIDPRAGQLTEQGEAAVREICRYFNLAPSRLGLSDSVSYNSKAEDNQSYLDTTLSPWLEESAAEMNVKLLSERQQDDDSHYFEHNVKTLLRMNAKGEAAVMGMQIMHSISSPNEQRKRLNMKPRPGGDEFKELNSVAPAGGFDKGATDEPRGPGEGDSQLDRNDPRRDPKKRVESVRRTFELAALARDKAAKGKRAFSEFLKVGLPKFPLDNPLRHAFSAVSRELDKVELIDEIDRLCAEHEEAILD